MAKLRSVSTSFWNDTYIAELDPIEKLLFLYLITNEANNMVGIYEISLRRIAFDTGIDKTMIQKIFEKFINEDKINYVSNYVVLKNFTKNNKYNANMWVGACDVLLGIPPAILAEIDAETMFMNMGEYPNGKEDLSKKVLGYIKDSKGLPKDSEGFQILRKSNLIKSNLIESNSNLIQSNSNSNSNINSNSNYSSLVATDSDESFSTQSVEVAEYLYESIIKWDPTHKYNRTKPAIKSWAKDIDKAIRIDGRDAESLKHMIHYLFNEKTQTAIFWAPNIQSGKTLREKFDIVKQKANHEHQSRKNTKGSYDPVAINETIKKALQGSQG